MAAFAAALTTAIPVIEKIVSAIWPAGKEKQGQDKQKATEKTNALASNAASLLKSIGDELGVVADFMVDCVVAEHAVVSMIVSLRNNPLTQQAKDDLNRDWALAKGHLTQLKDGNRDIQKIADLYTRVTLKAIVDESAGPIAQIDADLKNLERPNAATDTLKTELNDLQTKLGAVSALAGQIIQEISQGLNDSADKNKPASDKSSLNNIVSDRLPTLSDKLNEANT